MQAGAEPFDQDPRRWSRLVLVSVALLLAMSPWFAATAVAEALTVRWELSPGAITALTTVVQIGFVVGTALAALLNLADIWPSGRFFAGCALLAAGVNVALLVAPSYPVALGLRFTTGVLLAGVYPPAMKMIATWFRSARGFAIGTVVGALTIGKAAPYLLKALGGEGGAGPVLVGTSLAALTAGLAIALFYDDGPYRFERRPFEWRRVGRVLAHRETRLATAGYLGHMWELYAGWLLVTPYFAAVLEARGFVEVEGPAAAWGFLVIAAGGPGALVAGVLADRWGRERIANAAMVVSGIGSLTLGWLVGAPVAVAAAVAVVWGAAIVADSAQFSAVVTEVAPPDAVGTALTLQTMLGFALTGVSMQWASRLVETAGWVPALSLLALGPVAGIMAMRRLARLRRSAVADASR
ncbi:MAG: MFS transporter [Gemmatimonadetes bacterium]|nr:MFS transporter [Gemmatimonadota bacterium]